MNKYLFKHRIRFSFLYVIPYVRTVRYFCPVQNPYFKHFFVFSTLLFYGPLLMGYLKKNIWLRFCHDMYDGNLLS